MDIGLQARLSNLLSPRGHTLVAWLILVGGLAISALLTIATHWQLEREARRQFELNAKDILYRVQTELSSYEEVLVGLSAFLGSKAIVTRREFRRYVEGLDLARRYPGFENLNYAQWVKAADLRRFEEAVRRDASVQPGGYPSFKVTPQGERPEYHVITYIEPWDRSAASFGRDIAMSSPAALRTLERQRDTGAVMSSGRLIRIEGPNRHVGMAMRLAVYKPGMALDSVEARRAAFRGSVGAGYRVAEVMRVALREQQLRNIHFRLIDQGSEGGAGVSQQDRLLFDSDELRGKASGAEVGSEDRFEHRLGFSVAGRVWQIQFTAPKQASGVIGPVLPILVLLGAVTTTLLLFGLFRSYAGSRQRAEDLANAITADLRRSEASLAAAQRMAHLGDWHLSLADQSMRFSQEASALLGFGRGDSPTSLDAFLGKVHPAECEQVRLAIERCAAAGIPFDMEHRIVVRGAERWVHALGEPRRGPSGRTEIVHGTIMDINEHRLASRRNARSPVRERRPHR